MKRLDTVIAFACLLASVGVTAGGDGPEWSYTGEQGPEHWGDLAPEFIQCKVGFNQSPVDIANTVDSDLPALELNYTGSTTSIVNNGHTAQASVDPGNTLVVEGETFELLQFHLHTPSEHRINGRSFPLETHYVHRSEKGELAVIGILHEIGSASEQLEAFEAKIPAEINQPVPYVVALADLPITRMDHSYYRYNGSLTTPPCSEGVRWFVLKQTIPISRKQREIYETLIGEDARGPQPINARPILE